MRPILRRPAELPVRSELRWGRPRLLSGAIAVLLVVMTLGPALISAAPASAQVTGSEFPTAAVAPEDALAYFVFSLDDESEQWQLGNELLSRAGLGDALNEMREEALQDAAGNDLPLDAFLGGEIGVVLTDQVLEAAMAAGAAADPLADVGLADATAEAAPDTTEAQSYGVAAVLDVRAPDTVEAGIIGSIQDDAESAGATVEETDYEGVTITHVVGASAESSDVNVAVARIDDLILLSGSPADLEPLIDTSQGTTASIAESAPFTEVRASLDQDYLMYGFVNGVTANDAVEPLMSTLGAGFPTAEQPDAYYGMLLTADTPGLRFETVTIPAEGATLPPLAAPFDSELLAAAPANSLVFLSASGLGETNALDIAGAALISLAMGGSGGMATPAAGQTEEEMIAEQYRQLEPMIGFNIQTDLLDQLVGEYGFWVAGEADPATFEALFASGVADQGTVANALQQITLLIQSSSGGTLNVVTRPVEGAQVYTIDTGDPTIGDVEFGVVDGNLVIAYGTAVDTYVETDKASLADDAQFQEVMSTLPEARSATFYLNLARIIPLLQSIAVSERQDDEFAITDASEACADYDSAEEAQAAYDAGEEGTFDLDQDFDGQVCDDYFTDDTAEDDATPEAGVDADEAIDEAISEDFSAIKAFASTAYEEDGNRRTSSILYIGDEGDAAEATPAA